MNDNNSRQEPNFAGEKMKMPEGMVAPVAAEKHSGFGIVLALLFLALVLILGGLYFWYQSTLATPVIIDDITPARPSAEKNQEPESTTAEAQTEALGVVSSSNELDAISADLESTHLDSLTAELPAIDSAIEAEANAAE